MTYGFSRDDAGKFLNAYYDAKIFENDPFAKLDQTGVGKLMKMAIELGNRSIRTCTLVSAASTAGDPSSVEFCNSIGLDYVSCSPFRVPLQDWQRLRQLSLRRKRNHFLKMMSADMF